MAKVLVSLVSDQTIPNLMLIKEFQEIDRHVLISTQQMEKKLRSQDTIAASGIAPDRFEIVVVKEDALSDIEEQLRPLFFTGNSSSNRAILNSTDEFFVNLTGGTKIMSIGAYTFFKEYASHIFYIPIGKNHYSQIFPKTNQTDVPIHFRASLVEYLTAYGVKITNPSQMHSLVKQPTETEVFFKCYLQTNHSEKAILSGLRESRSMQAKFVNTSAFSGLDQVLCQLQFSPKETGRLNKSEIRYLTGEWLEEYLLARINDFHQLSPPYSGVGIEISRATIRNEFDVMVMLNNTLHVFECKTSVFTGEKSTLWNDTLYKLQALRKDFGLSAKAYIVTLSEIGAAKGQIKLDRSEVFGIQVIDRNTLQSAEMLEDILKKMR